MTNIKTFEQFRDFVWEERGHAIDCLVDRLEELNDFELGRYRGEVMAYDNLLEVLRGMLKHGGVE